MTDYDPAEGRLPIVRAKQTVSIIANVVGTWREVFWLKHTKKGDLLTYSGVSATRLLRTVGRASIGGIVLADELETLGQGDELKRRTHLTIHPSRDEPGKERAVVSGMGGTREVSFDLHKLRTTQEALVIQMTDPLRYPEWNGKTDAIKFGNIFKENAVPEFRVYVTPLVGHQTVTESIPFMPGYSADYVAEPVGLSTRHLLFQIRLGYQYRDTFPPHHMCLIPTQREGG